LNAGVFSLLDFQLQSPVFPILLQNQKKKHLGMALHQHPMIDLGVLGPSGQRIY
jgi:hypothetical protein